MWSRIPLITTILAIVLLLPATAGAALVDEQRQGQNLIAELQAGTRTCSSFSADDLDHIGEYVMFRALGSTSLHEAMNARMIAMMGEQAESRMHQLLGARYAGCTTNGLGIVGASSMRGGSGMMGGYYNNGGLGAMMSSDDWNWMMGGTWQHMTRQDWNQLQRRLLGTTRMSNHTGWSALAIIIATLGAVLLVLLAVLGLTRRRPFRRPRAPAPSS
jgi:hypothetical protein